MQQKLTFWTVTAMSPPSAPTSSTPDPGLTQVNKVREKLKSAQEKETKTQQTLPSPP